MSLEEKQQVYEFVDKVDEIEKQAELMDRTENHSIKGSPAPVNEDIAEYTIGPLESLLEIWNEADDAARNHQENRRKTSRLEQLYREAERTLYEYSDFLTDCYDLDNSIGRLKVEARYEW